MEISARTELRPLTDADLTTRDRAEDIRSRKVVDARGEEESYLRSIYTHYGLDPYWGAGYVYPSLPSYPRPHPPAERRW